MITTTGLKARLNIPGTSEDAWLGPLTLAAEGFVKRYLGRNHLEKPGTAISEIHDGDGDVVLVAREFPFTAGDITTLTVDGETITAKTSWDGTGFYVDHDSEGEIILDGLEFNRGRQNIEIVYKPGFGTSGSDGAALTVIAEATYQIAARLYNKKSEGAYSNFSVGEVTEAFNNLARAGELQDELALLQPFRKL